MLGLNLTHIVTPNYFSLSEFVFYDNPPSFTPQGKPYSTAKPFNSNLSKLSQNSLSFDTLKYQKCTVLIIHFYLLESASFLLQQLNSKFNSPCHYLYQRACSTLCDPKLNWHYFFSLQYAAKDPTMHSPTSVLTIPRNTYIRNAATFDSITNNTFVLVRFQWIYLKNKISFFENFNQIQTISDKRKQNLEKAPCHVVLPYKLPETYKSFQPYHLVRSESNSNPAMLLHYRIVERINGTLELAYARRNQNFFTFISETPNAMTGMYGINHERWLKVDYSSYLDMSKLLFVTGLPKPSGYSFAFLFKPLSFWIWINTSCSFLLLTVSLKLLFPCQLKIGQVAFAFFLPLIDQSMPSKFWALQITQHHLFVTRFMIISWLFSCLLLSNLYRSFIAGYLIQPSLTFPPKTIRELALSKYSLGYQDTAQDNIKQAIFSSINELVKSNQSHRFVMLNVTQCFARILSSPSACINFAGMVEMFGTSNLVDAEGNKLFTVSEDSIFPTVAANPFNPSSDLKDAISITIRRYLSSGLFDKGSDILRQFNIAIGIRKRKRECQEAYDNKPSEIASNSLYCNSKPSLEFSTEIVMYPVFVLLIGISSCIIIFLYEIIGSVKCTNVRKQRAIARKQ